MNEHGHLVKIQEYMRLTTELLRAIRDQLPEPVTDAPPERVTWPCACACSGCVWCGTVLDADGRKPENELQARLAQLDTSERGTADARRELDAEVMDDLAEARGAANRLGGLYDSADDCIVTEPEAADCPQCADLRQQLSDAHLSTETLRKTVDTLKRQHAGLQRHIQRLVSEPETPCPQCADLEGQVRPP